MSGPAQGASTTKLGVFWNVQRFFDTQGGPIARAYGGTQDNWDEAAYQAKLNAVCAVLQDIGTRGEVALLGLCEVESPQILADLVDRLGWSHLVDADKYFRDQALYGLDVALLHSKKTFYARPRSVRTFAIGGGVASRDMMAVELIHKRSNKPVHVFVVHWMSRLVSEGGMSRLGQAFALRQMIARTLKYPKEELVRGNGAVVMPPQEEIMARWEMPAFIMGDFNDEPFDASLSTVLSAEQSEAVAARRTKLTAAETTSIAPYLKKRVGLYNPSWKLLSVDDGDHGTYYFYPRWRAYDQLLASRGALPGHSHLTLRRGSVTEYRRRTVTDPKGETVEVLTKSGRPLKFDSASHRGVSDHLPLLFELQE